MTAVQAATLSSHMPTHHDMPTRPLCCVQTCTKVAGGWGFMVAAVAFYDGTAALMKDVYGKQILPVFPLKPVNKVSLGDFGTKRFVDAEKQQTASARCSLP
mgnify:CR=1 FL=1